ncbi:ammonium transporter AmtB-like domain-containing protein, partial [Tricladium varicosporioides]
DYAWMLTSTALVFMMVPGISLFYSGLRSQSTALSLIWLNMMAVSVVSVQWFLFGYSLVFSPNSTNSFIGDLSTAVFDHTTAPLSFAGVRSGEVPALVFGLFQGMFASFTLALVTGVIAEKGRLLPFLVFGFVWTTLVYDPIAYWVWNSQGWATKCGILDWAGGTPVHICSGAATLAYTLMLKWYRRPSGRVRRELGLESHNMTNVLLGTMLVWFGWFGFNAGSELHANMRASSSFLATNLAATSAGITYTMLEEAFHQKWSGLGFCTGAFVGLVAITPAAGYVSPWAGLVIGITASIACFLAQISESLKDWLEEPLDISIIHGIGGIWGMFMTGIFADKKIIALDSTSYDESTSIVGGAINGRAIQIGYQLAGAIAAFAYSFLVTLVILLIIQTTSKWIPGLDLRVRKTVDQEINLDNMELGDAEAVSYLYHCSMMPLSFYAFFVYQASVLDQFFVPTRRRHYHILLPAF